jgi:transposase
LVFWSEIELELSKRYVTYKQVYQEYATNLTSYDSFLREIKKRISQDLESTVRIRLQHKPGEKIFIDYTDGIDLLAPKTGEIQSTQLFVGVLPCSGMVFGEFVFSQRKNSFLLSQERMFAFFGGVSSGLVA